MKSHWLRPLFSSLPRFGLLMGVVLLGAMGAGLRAETASDVPANEDGHTEDGSVDAELARRDGLFRREHSLFSTLIEPWRKKRIQWNEQHGLELSFSYDSLVQIALGGVESTSAAAGEAALTGRWNLFNSNRKFPEGMTRYAERNPISLNFRFRNRHRYTDQPPSDLGDDIGAIWRTTDGFNDHGFEIPDFYIRQFVERWNLELRYGQLSVNNQLDRYALRGAKQSFLNRAFSKNPAVAFPRFGAGATAQWKGDSGWDVTAAITQVQASDAGDEVDLDLGSSDLFYGFQVGRTFDGWGGDPARIQVLVWHADAIENEDIPSGSGFSAVLEQNFKDEGLRAFVRYAHAEHEATDASNLITAGIGKNVGDNDLLGIGFGMGNSAVNGDWQATFECFYRWQVGSELHITPDVQFLFGDGFTEGRSQVIPGIRCRLAF